MQLTTINNVDPSKIPVALVTGASRGIGRACLRQLAHLGYFVIGTATTNNGADTITQYLSDCNIEGVGLVLDVSDTESIKNVINYINKEFSAPVVLVNNAGITRDNLTLRMSDSQWQEVVSTNLTGVFKVTQACLRNMLKQKVGRIINISSVVAHIGNPGQANYVAAKSGVIGFTKSIAHEVASRGITANIVAPGFITTDMTDKLTTEQQENILNNVPMQRMGSVQDIANTVTFLASTAASYITGETINVNGGMLMT